jgi:hypothetical protein
MSPEVDVDAPFSVVARIHVNGLSLVASLACARNAEPWLPCPALLLPTVRETTLL